MSTTDYGDSYAAVPPAYAGLQLASATEAVRIECATAFGADYADGTITPEKRRSAEIVLKLFIADAAETVRAAIACHLVACPYLPKGLARAIADDVDAIAVPMIRGSAAFDDDDLIDIVRVGRTACQVAVATRETVSRPVSSALVETGDVRVVSALLANDGARIAAADLEAILDAFAGVPGIEGLVIGREVLPLAVIDRLMEAAGFGFQALLEDAMDLPGAIVGRVCRLAREQLVVGHVRARENIREVAELATRLAGQGRLTSTLLLRALCTGDAQFFAIGLAVCGGGDVEAIRRLVQRGDYDGVRKAVADAGWSSTLGRAFVVVLRLYNAEKADPRAIDTDIFAPKAVDRLVHEFAELSPAGLDAVLAEICWKLA